MRKRAGKPEFTTSVRLGRRSNAIQRRYKQKILLEAGIKISFTATLDRAFEALAKLEMPLDNFPKDN